MSNKATTQPPKQGSLPALVSPRSQREVLLDALLATTTDPIHSRILKAYKAGGTVEAAEAEFSIIVEEIINET
jgi:hypothetical protein